MKQKFRTYETAVQLYRECKDVQLPAHLKMQLLRASSSVALNLAEGSGKSSTADRLRFFEIAMGSLREVQAVFDLELSEKSAIRRSADQLGANLFCLIRSMRH